MGARVYRVGAGGLPGATERRLRSWESTGLVARTVFKTAEAGASRLVGSIPTLSRQFSNGSRFTVVFRQSTPIRYTNDTHSQRASVAVLEDFCILSREACPASAQWLEHNGFDSRWRYQYSRVFARLFSFRSCELYLKFYLQTRRRGEPSRLKGRGNARLPMPEAGLFGASLFRC